MLNELPVNGSIPRVVLNQNGRFDGDLLHYYYVIKEYATNLDNPFHNWGHGFGVGYLFYEGCNFHDYALSSHDCRMGTIGGLLHDVNHCGRLGDDDLNIARSARFLRRYFDPQDAPYVDEIISIFGPATQYPYICPAKDLSLAGKILRDADVMEALESAWVQPVIRGLAAEWRMTFEQVFEIQERFLRSIEWATGWAREKFPPHTIEAKIEEAREFVAMNAWKPDPSWKPAVL